MYDIRCLRTKNIVLERETFCCAADACCYAVRGGHAARWVNTVGTLDISRIGELYDSFAEYPLDVTSFHPGVYGFVYLCGVCLYFVWRFGTRPPHAEMKGEEHGSNDFMSFQELKEFRESRILPDFDYCEMSGKQRIFTMIILRNAKRERGVVSDGKEKDTVQARKSHKYAVGRGGDINLQCAEI